MAFSPTDVRYYAEALQLEAERDTPDTVRHIRRRSRPWPPARRVAFVVAAAAACWAILVLAAIGAAAVLGVRP